VTMAMMVAPTKKERWDGAQRNTRAKKRRLLSLSCF